MAPFGRLGGMTRMPPPLATASDAGLTSSGRCKDADVMPRSADDVPTSRWHYRGADGTPTSADVERICMLICRRRADVWPTSVCRCRDENGGPTFADFEPFCMPICRRRADVEPGMALALGRLFLFAWPGRGAAYRSDANSAQNRLKIVRSVQFACLIG